MDQVLVVLVAEEALASLVSRCSPPCRERTSFFCRCAAGCSRWPSRMRAGCNRSPCWGPQAQVGVVVLRPGQLPVRAREQRVGSRRFSTTAPSAPVRARAPPSAASVICVVVSPNLPFFFLRGQFFLVGRAFSPAIRAGVVMYVRPGVLHDFFRIA